jgi:hypothetical protein
LKGIAANVGSVAVTAWRSTVIERTDLAIDEWNAHLPPVSVPDGVQSAYKKAGGGQEERGDQQSAVVAGSGSAAPADAPLPHPSPGPAVDTPTGAGGR